MPDDRTPLIDPLALPIVEAAAACGATAAPPQASRRLPPWLRQNLAFEA